MVHSEKWEKCSPVLALKCTVYKGKKSQNSNANKVQLLRNGEKIENASALPSYANVLLVKNSENNNSKNDSTSRKNSKKRYVKSIGVMTDNMENVENNIELS